MQKQLVHFHNETKIRQYDYTDDLDVLAARIRHDAGSDKDIARMTYKVPHSDDFVVLSPPLFATMNKTAEGVIDVQFAVKREVLFDGEDEARAFLAQDLDTLLAKVEEEAERPVDRIVYTVDGPENAKLEFKAARDTFCMLDATYKVYFGQGEPERDEEERVLRRRASIEDVDIFINVQIPTEDEAVKISIAEGWQGVELQLQDLCPEGQEYCGLTYVPPAAPQHTGLCTLDEIELTEETFYELQNKPKLLFFGHFKFPHSLRIPVDLGAGLSPRKFNATTIEELVALVEKAGGRVLDCLKYEVTGPHGQQLECIVDEDSFTELETVEGLLLHAVFHDDEADPNKPRRRVLMPGEDVPVLIAATTWSEFESQLRIHTQDGVKITALAYETTQSDHDRLKLDEAAWEKLKDPETDLIHVYTTDTCMRLIRLPGSKEFLRIMADSYPELITKIQERLEPEVEVQKITFQQTDEEEIMIRTLDNLNYNDIGDNSTEYYVWLGCPGDKRTVQLPGEDTPRIFHAATFEELISDVEAESGVMVAKLTYDYVPQKDGEETYEVELNADTFEALEDPTAVLKVHFKEIPTLKVLFPDEEKPIEVSVAQYDELVEEIHDFRPGREIDSLTYTVYGPKGQKIVVPLDEDSFEEIATDPDASVIQVALLPPAKTFELLMDGHTINVKARTYSSLSKSISTAAGGQVLEAVTFKEKADGPELPFNEENFPKVDVEKPPLLTCKLAPVEEDAWFHLHVKFPFEASPRKISGVEWDGVVRELDKQRPPGFTGVDRVFFMERRCGEQVEKVVTDEAHLDDAEEDSVFFVDYKWDTALPPPTREVTIEGDEAGKVFKVQALTYPDFLAACKDVAGGHPVHGVTYNTTVDGKEISAVLIPDMFMDLPLSTKFSVTVGENKASDGVQVKFPDDADTCVLAAHSYERLIALIEREALKRQRRVEQVTYEVEAPNGTWIELDDLCAEVFEEMDDIENVVFKVHYVGEMEGLRLVKFDDGDNLEEIVADTFQEFVAKIEQLEDEQPIEAITYEIPAPNGCLVQFPLDENSWEDVKDDLSTVFQVHLAEPTSELQVQFPWCQANSPIKLPAGSFDELLENVEKQIPGDQQFDQIFYTVVGPWGGNVQLPLDETCFEEIEDAEQQIIVKTKPAKCIHVQYPPHSLHFPSSFEALLEEVKEYCPPNKKVAKIKTKPASEGEGDKEKPKQEEVEVTVENWKEVLQPDMLLSLDYQ